MNLKKILFLNPPGKKIYIRDYYCSKVSKAYYLPQPVDLLIQTSFFDDKEYNLKVLDAVAEKKNKKAVMKEILLLQPDYIITMCGSVSFEEDDAFFRSVKDAFPKVTIFSSGDLFLEDPTYFIGTLPWLDGVITDFFYDGPKQFIEGGRSGIWGFVYDASTHNGFSKEETEKSVNIPQPKHYLFKNHLYRMPFTTKLPMATVLTNYSCPYPCTFCIMSTLPYKSRTAAEVITELENLERLGIRYLYFSDQTFFVDSKITTIILNTMIDKKMGFEWVCFSRVDILDRDKMALMKKAGCNMIMFGVEWAEDEYCRKYKKQYSTREVREAFKIAREVGIKRMGTFLLGVPGQTEESIRNTVTFAIDLDSDYASFNVAVPRATTSFRKEALELGLIQPEDRIMDQSGSFVQVGNGTISAAKIARLKKEAYRRFYFRPSYISKRLQSITNVQEFKNHVKEGYRVLKNTFT